MKKQNYYKGLYVGLLAISLTACKNDGNIVGKWVQPVPGLPSLEQGIILEENGRASSVNMATLQYETWEQKGSSLILTGKSIGNHQSLPFSDTLHVEKLTTDSLVLKKGKLILRYARDINNDSKRLQKAYHPQN